MTSSDTGLGDDSADGMEHLHPDILSAAQVLDLTLPALDRAASTSRRILEVATRGISARIPGADSPFDVVVLGSVARLEASDESDFDFLLVAHERPSDPRFSRDLLEAVEGVRRSELGLGKPGTTRMFGGAISAADLTERIGLEQDTNRTHSHRILLLEESRSIFRPDLHRQLIEGIVERYLLDADTREFPVPRFLLNDIIRYWRTLAVDYEAKRWEGLDQNWGLRYLKLRISRKIAFAGTLATLLACPSPHRLEEHLVEEFAKPPLARFAQLHDRLEAGLRPRVHEVLEIADGFTDRLGDREFRQTARNVSDRGQLEASQPMREVREGARRLQKALEAIFFDSALLGERSRHYLSF